MRKSKRESHENLIRILKAAVVISSQKQVARNLGISPQFLSDILRGHRKISERVALAMGYESHTEYICTGIDS